MIKILILSVCSSQTGKNNSDYFQYLKIFMTYKINELAREIAGKLEAYKAHLEWLEADRKRLYGKPEEQQPTSQPAVTSETKSQELTPEQVKQQFALRREQFLDEAIQELGKQFPSQLFENQTQKLPSAPAPKTHEEILKMVKKGDSIDSILLRFQGVE
jgi:hypothetical protein